MIKMQQGKTQKNLLNILQENDEDYFRKQNKTFIYLQFQYLFLL